MDAEAVGGFQEYNGSYLIPPPILGTYGDPDDYDPNWVGYGEHAYAIAAGASAGPNGPVGFTNWYVKSTAATAIGSLNIIALGGEGSTSATTLTLTDDGSNTMLYATYLSDSLLSDWENLTTINLVNTSGFVTLTGAETTAQEGPYSYSYGFGGLLTDTGANSHTASWTSGLTILGGGGNSFYDLSGMGLTAAHLSNIDGGHGTTFNTQLGSGGNSEVAFNNSVVANAPVGSPFGGETVTLSHISILDDASDSQGGAINMANFGVVAGAGNTGLEGLNQNYALISEDNATGPTGQVLVPDGLPFTSTLPVVQDAIEATPGLSNDIVPAGYEVLQLLDSQGSTATTQTSDLTIVNGPWDFAINAQDMANGWWTYGEQPADVVLDSIGIPVVHQPLAVDGYNLYIQGQNTVPTAGTNNVTVTDTLRYYISDDGVDYVYKPDGQELSYKYSKTLFTLSDTPVVQIANYTTVDFFLPYESLPYSHSSTPIGVVSASDPSSDPGSPFANYVVLGSTYFSDTPVVVADANGQSLNASLNFYDNQTDTGGSDPGGPDNLVLGHTNFAYNPGQNPAGLQIADIGHTTVNIDANTVMTSINDYGAGSFEIGATNANVLEAASTSHLIMDAPGTLDYYNFNLLPHPDGITVTGSATGQNLLQGTSGTVFVDPASNGDHGSIFTPPNSAYDGPFQGVGTFAGLSTGDGFAVTEGGVGNTLEATVQSAGAYGGWGNDVLNGGAGYNGVQNVEVGGLTGAYVDEVWVPGTYYGNSGDNFFPEGGNDTVNFGGPPSASSHTHIDGTVWFGMYDVSNSGDNPANGILLELRGRRRLRPGDHRHRRRKRGLRRRLWAGHCQRRRSHRQHDQLVGDQPLRCWEHRDHRRHH